MSQIKPEDVLIPTPQALMLERMFASIDYTDVKFDVQEGRRAYFIFYYDKSNEDIRRQIRKFVTTYYRIAEDWFYYEDNLYIKFYVHNRVMSLAVSLDQKIFVSEVECILK